MNYDAGQEDPFLPPRDGAATLERYSARREQPSTSGVGRRPTSAVSQRYCGEKTNVFLTTLSLTNSMFGSGTNA